MQIYKVSKSFMIVSNRLQLILKLESNTTITIPLQPTIANFQIGRRIKRVALEPKLLTEFKPGKINLYRGRVVLFR